MPKRKRKEVKATDKSKLIKGAPSGVAMTAATNAIVLQNSTTSPLLRLPAEIRNKIWTYVLGDQLVHIRYQQSSYELNFETNDSAWQHVVCEHDCPEDSTEEMLRPSDGDTILRARHSICHEYFQVFKPIGLGHPSTMRLNILRASRQIYSEAGQILWTTNTFSFTNGVTFNRFMMDRTVDQKRLIRSLRFEMCWGEYSHWNDELVEDWNSALNSSLVRSIQNVRSLRLMVTLDMRGKQGWIPDKNYCAGLRRLSILPLTNAEVGIRALYLRPGTKQELYEEERRVAEQLINLLLTPSGVPL